MKKSAIYKLLPYMIMSSLALTACGEKSECDLPTRHVHLYTKEIDNDITISKYKDSENLYDMDGYHWNEDYIEINKMDEDFYKVLSKNGLFDAKENWDYLYYNMSRNKDYLEYYYKYTEIVTDTYTDSDGKKHTDTKEVEHKGWHRDKFSSHNTGEIRLCHTVYCGYRINYDKTKEKFYVEASPYVDDVRYIMEDYPYVGERSYTEVNKEHYVLDFQIPFVEPEDYYDDFEHPDLSNTSPTLSKTK